MGTEVNKERYKVYKDREDQTDQDIRLGQLSSLSSGSEARISLLPHRLGVG